MNNKESIKKIIDIFKEYQLDVRSPDQVFKGPYVRNAPGFVIVNHPSDTLPVLGTMHDNIIIYKDIATHSKYGIFLIKSEDADLVQGINKIQPIKNTLPASIISMILDIPISTAFEYKETIMNIFNYYKT